MNGCFYHRVTWARVLCLKPVLFLRIKATIVAFVGKGSVVMFVNTTKLQHFQSHWLTLGSRIKSSAKRFYPFINAFIDAVNIISFPLHLLVVVFFQPKLRLAVSTFLLLCMALQPVSSRLSYCHHRYSTHYAGVPITNTTQPIDIGLIILVLSPVLEGTQ